ncbi:MAG TPA: hypothetical protein VNK41_08210 [Vicinamibacterales bacterium]|nr:hypothetical protein [Vicinamibacterales bacterium]
MGKYSRVWVVAAVLAMAAVPGVVDAQSASRGSAPMVVDIPQDKLYHRPACPLVRAAGSKVKLMRQSEAVRRGMKPHECPVLADGSEDPNAVPVYVQEGDDRYHKEGCRKLGENAKEVTLAEGGKGRWPCTVCRPPIRKAVK